MISGLDTNCRQLRQMRRSSTSPCAPKVERIIRPQLPSPVQPPPARRLLNSDHGLAGKQFLKMLFGTSNVAANCERKSGAAAAKLNHRKIQKSKRYNNGICRPRQQKVQNVRARPSIQLALSFAASIAFRVAVARGAVKVVVPCPRSPSAIASAHQSAQARHGGPVGFGLPVLSKHVPPVRFSMLLVLG